MRRCGFNTGSDFHLLDHIGPLSYFLKMPLYIEEEKNFTLSRHYYPMVESIHFPEMATNLAFFAQSFDELYECKFWKPHLKQLFKDLYQKEMHLIFCAHGQSDKGYGAPLLHPYATQDVCLIYGQLLKEMLQELKIDANYQFTGNYRRAFYLEHQKFYDAIAQEKIFSRLPKKQFTLLYAPTWNDADGATSFFETISKLRLPDDINLIVKVHPLLEQRNPGQYYCLASVIEKRANSLLVDDFPLVYPLLAGVDAYLGDYSSVGYDFLYFKKPMFFLLNPQLPFGRIHKCGKILENIEDLVFENHSYLEKQEELYLKAFSLNRHEGEEQKEPLIHSLCQ